MPSEVIIAAAGGGKTTALAARARVHAAGSVALVTFTNNNVDEVRAKFLETHPAIPQHVEIWSWFRFLLHELARPYQRAVLDRRIDGLSWTDGRSAPKVPRSKTIPFFLAGGSSIYSDKISQFVIDCNKASGGAVIARLEDRFDTIFIDEIQDLAGYDLDLLELILKSKINLVMVGDHRQATYSTNKSPKNSAFGGAKIIGKFQAWEKAGLLTIQYARDTYRCHQRIADLADSFYPNEPTTLSKNHTGTGHDGVFLVSSASTAAYIERFNPQILRYDRRTNCGGLPARNFGDSKGMTFERVLIYPHKKGRDWIASGNYSHVEASRAKMYVGVSRARHSVAFVFDGETKIPGLQRFG